MTQEKDKMTQCATIADRFLQDARNSRKSVSLYLVSGYQLKGEVVEFDAKSILFKHKDTCQIVVRSAVTSMYPLLKSKEDAASWWRQYTSEESGD